jgi:hypothetical protein
MKPALCWLLLLSTLTLPARTALDFFVLDSAKPGPTLIVFAPEKGAGADNPHFPALRSVPLALSGASRRKQSPCRGGVVVEVDDNYAGFTPPPPPTACASMFRKAPIPSSSAAST